MNDFDILASAIARRPLAVTEGRWPRTWTDGESIHVRQGCDDQRAEILIQAALLRSGSLAEPALIPRGRRARRRFALLEASRSVALLPPRLRRHVQMVPPPVTASVDQSAMLARSRTTRLPSLAVVGEIRVRSLRLDRPIAASTGADPATAESLPEGDLQGLTQSEGTTLPKLMNVRRSAVTFRRRRKRTIEASAGKASVLGDFAGSTRAGIVVLEDIDAVALDRLDEGRRSRGSLFPEWDHGRGEYRTDWCRVTVVTPTSAGRQPPPPDDLLLRRALVHLNDGYQRRRAAPAGDSLDLDAVVDHLVRRRTGSATTEDIHIDQRNRRRDLSMQLCLDLSGSAADPSPSGGTVHAHQVHLADTIVSAMESLGQRTALHGFRSHGRGNVEMVALKALGESYDAAARARLHGTVPAGRTRLGAAIRWGRRELARDRSGTHRLLVIVSDGFAYDTGYEGTSARLDARRALLEARTAGVACLCISVGSAEPTSDLEAVFGSAAFLAVDRTSDLLPHIRSAIEQAFDAAAIQRRHLRGAPHSA